MHITGEKQHHLLPHKRKKGREQKNERINTTMACRAALYRLPLHPKFHLVSASSSTTCRISGLYHQSPRVHQVACRPKFLLEINCNRARPWELHQVSRYRVCGMHSEAKLESTTRLMDDNQLSQKWKIKMLYDGECPLCMREVNMLKERNNHYGAIKFVDISSSDYSPEENEGLDYRTVMGRIHAILSDGTVLRDIDAFRKLYEEVGLGWVYAITKYEPIATIANAIYSVWAKYRLQITGRPSLEDILESRMKKSDEECSEKACKI